MRKEIFGAGEYYHVYNRGVDQRDVFLDDHDRLRFLHTLYILNNFEEMPHRFDVVGLSPRELLEPRAQPLVHIAAGCFMTNHFHLALSPVENDGVSRFLHKVGVSYGKYFNTKRERSGRLFESTFKAKHITSDAYAQYITQYIHLNPRDLFPAPTPELVEQYQWSSLPEYIGRTGKFSLILDASFRDEVLGMRPDEYQKLFRELFHSFHMS